MDTTISVSTSHFGDYCIARIRAPHKKLTKQLISNVLLIDNSGSMGNNTHYATDIIGKGMFNLPKDKI